MANKLRIVITFDENNNMVLDYPRNNPVLTLGLLKLAEATVLRQCEAPVAPPLHVVPAMPSLNGKH